MLFFARWFLWPLRLIVTLFSWFMLSIIILIWMTSGFVMGQLPNETWKKQDLGGFATGYKSMLHFVFLTSPKKE